MFEKLKISGILEKFPKAEGPARKEMLDRLATLGELAVPMTADELRYNRLLYADAVDIFSKIYKRELLPVFIKGLGDLKENMRELYSETIAKHAGSLAVPLLVEKLTDDDHTLRKAAGELLVSLGGPSLASRIIPLLKSESKDVKKTAMDVLTALKIERAADALAPLLDDKDSWIRRKATEAICKLKEKSTLPRLREILAKEKDPSALKLVIETIGEIGGAEDSDALLPAIKTSDMVTRQLASAGIVKTADSTIVPKLVDMLKEEDVNIRRAVVDILNGLKDPRTAAALIRALKDGDWWVREIATDALSSLGGGNVSHMIMGLLKDTDEYVRRSAVEFYCRVRDESVYGALVELLDDNDWWVREKAITALGLIGDSRAIPHIARHVHDREVKWAIPRALKSMDSPEALKPLSIMLHDEQRQIRLEALAAISALDGEDAVKMIKSAVEDKDQEVVNNALKALRERTGRIWLKEDVLGEKPKAPANGATPIVNFTDAKPGDIRTEAVLVVDICRSTDLAQQYGDSFVFKVGSDLFETIIPMAKENNLLFYKSTGDGYLMTFDSVSSALKTAAETLSRIEQKNTGVELKRRTALRFAINIGEVRVDNNFDRVGVAVNMTFRADGVKEESSIQPPGAPPGSNFPVENRILLTEPAYLELKGSGEFEARPLGFFELKGITGLHKLFEYSRR